MKHDIKKLVTKWKPVLNDNSHQRDDIRAVFLEEQYLYKKQLEGNECKESFAPYSLAIINRIVDKLLTNGTIKDIEEANAEYETIKLNYTYNIFNDPIKVELSLFMELVQHEIEEAYIKLAEKGSLILPVAPLITYKDLTNHENESGKIEINILKPIQKITSMTTDEFKGYVMDELDSANLLKQLGTVTSIKVEEPEENEDYPKILRLLIENPNVYQFTTAQKVNFLKLHVPESDTLRFNKAFNYLNKLICDRNMNLTIKTSPKENTNKLVVVSNEEIELTKEEEDLIVAWMETNIEYALGSDINEVQDTSYSIIEINNKENKKEFIKDVVREIKSQMIKKLAEATHKPNPLEFKSKTQETNENVNELSKKESIFNGLVIDETANISFVDKSEKLDSVFEFINYIKSNINPSLANDLKTIKDNVEATERLKNYK